MYDLDATMITLRTLKDLGVSLAIDDFGTGYSSLSYLRHFPVDILKVDRSFVSRMHEDPGDAAIVQAVVHLGRSLRITTVAEGVESRDQAFALRAMGCDQAQGYHFARPQPAEATIELLTVGLPG